MPAGLISGAVVSGLGHEALRKVLNQLLTVEAAIHKVLVGDLDVSCRDNDPDGGIDAKIKWPAADSSHDSLKPGVTVLQYKSGKITLPQISKEFKKGGVQAALKKGGRYLLLVGHDYVGKDADKRRKKLKDLCRKKRISAKRCAILFGSHIARWISRHPSVVIMPELGSGLPAFVTVDGWRALPQFQNPWKPDALRLDVIAKIQVFARRETSSYIMRIEGPAGVGKSRTALEAFRHPGIEQTAIYTPIAEQPSVAQLITALQGNPEAEALIVIDECDRDEQESLRPFVDLAQGRLRLICIGHRDVLSQAPLSMPDSFLLVPLADSIIKEIIEADLGTVIKEVSDVAVRLSGGYVKLALFVVHYLSVKKDIAPADLAKIDDIRDFLDRFVDSQTRQALGLLSLLARVGWEDEVKDEAQALVDFFEIKMNDFKAGVKALKDRGVVMTRGRYLYVSPDLLAISAAAYVWETHGSELINIVPKLPRESARRELLGRLASMGQQPQVKKAVEDLLGTEGLFRTLPELDEGFRSEAFAILSSALPDSAVAVLERLIEKASRGELSDFKAGRRNVVWAIESLLRWPTTSLTAARCLMLLALSENETWANNATGIFCEYFHMHLSRSPIPLIERLTLLDELIEMGDSASRLLASKAGASGLKFYESRSGSPTDPYSGLVFPPEWRPQTWDELWSSFQAVIDRLIKIADGTDEAATHARVSLIGAALVLVGQGMAEQTIKALDSIKPATDKEQRQLLDATRRLERELKDRLSPAQVLKLHEIAGKYFDSSYLGRLKRWAGGRLYTDFDATDPVKGDRNTDLQIQALAEEGLKSGISDAEMTWLASPEAENVWQFGYRLGQIDVTNSFFNRIVSNSPDNQNALLFASYVSGRSNVSGESYRDRVLDELESSRPVLAFTGTWRGGSGSSAGLNRILRLMKAGAIAAEWLGFLMWGGWSKSLGTEDVSLLVRAMLDSKLPVLFEPATHVLITRLSDDHASIRELAPLMWRLIAMRPARNSEWNWAQIASKLIALDSKRVIEVVVSFFEGDEFIAITSDETMKVLSAATDANPERAWGVIGNRLLKDDRVAMRLVTSLSSWYGNLIPKEVLIAWAKNHLPRGPWIVARLIAVRQTPLPELARALILAFPDDARVRNQFAATLQTGFHMGPFSERLKTDLAFAECWAKDRSPVIRSWARQLVRALAAQLKRQLIREEEEQ